VDRIPLPGDRRGFAVVAALISLALNPRHFANLPNDWCFLAYSVAILLSRPANGWVGGAYPALLAILPLMTFYFLIRLAVQTEAHLRGLMAAFVLLTLFQAGNGILQYHTGLGLGARRLTCACSTTPKRVRRSKKSSESEARGSSGTRTTSR